EREAPLAAPHGLLSFFFLRPAFQRFLKRSCPRFVQGLERLLGKNLDIFPLYRGDGALTCLPTTPAFGTNRLAFAQAAATRAGIANRLTEDAPWVDAAVVGVFQSPLMIELRFADFAAQCLGVGGHLFLRRGCFLVLWGWSFLVLLRGVTKRHQFQARKTAPHRQFLATGALVAGSETGFALMPAAATAIPSSLCWPSIPPPTFPRPFQ